MSGSLTITAGSQQSLPFRWESQAAAAIDVSAATEIKWWLFSAAPLESSTPLLEKTMSASQISRPNGGADGRFDVSLLSADTDGYAAGTYYWQAQVSIGPAVFRCDYGTVTINSSYSPP